MKSVAVVSQKGGVGKTTLVLNLGFSFARAGYSVALIDADPQGAVGHSLKGAAESRGLAGFAAGAALESVMLRTRFAELSIVPAGEVEPHLVQDFYTSQADGGTFRALLAGLSEFDLVLIDTPSGFNGATLGALRVVDFALSPLQAEPIALRTLPQLLAAIGALRAAGAHVELAGVVLSMLQARNADSLGVAEEIWSRMPSELVLEATVPRDPTVLAASAAGVPLGLFRPLHPPPASLVFDQLASELLPRLGLVREGEEGDEPVSLFA